MKLLIRNYRTWWQIPRRAGERQQDRQVTFLELFYDLVYVVIIAELAHTLAGHFTPLGIGHFAFMFTIVWFAWINGTAYHEIHGNNDVRTRVFTFLQMLAVIAMAVFAHNAIGSGSIGFAYSFAAFQLILTVLWWRTGIHDKNHSPLSAPYALVFLLTTIVFIASTFVAEPMRYYVWGVAMLILVTLPLSVFSRGKKNQEVKEQIKLVTTATPSFVERFGLFTIIVLGEVIVGVVAGLTHGHLSPSLWVAGIAGSLFAIGIWWVYFDFVSHRIPKSGITNYLKWTYLHLPMTMAIAAVGAAAVYIIEHLDKTIPSLVWATLIGSLIIFLTTMALLVRIVKQPENLGGIIPIGSLTMIISSILLLGLYFANLSTVATMVAILIPLFLPVGVGLYLWLREGEKNG